MDATHNDRAFEDDADYSAHVRDYRAFLRILWRCVAGIALTLVLLAAFFG